MRRGFHVEASPHQYLGRVPPRSQGAEATDVVTLEGLFDDLPDGDSRRGDTSWILTCSSWLALESPRYILMKNGPAAANWSFGMRGTEQLTRTGTVTHFWRDQRRGTYFDEPELVIEFQSGSLYPIREASGRVIALPQGLINYYEFFDLLDEPKILPDGRPNYVQIHYRSLLYPSLIIMGFFVPEASFSVQDDSRVPGRVSWAATFRVHDSAPRFNQSNELRRAWLAGP